MPNDSAVPAFSTPVSTRIEVRDSSIHGHGVFATRSIPAGTLIGRYVGRLYTADQMQQRGWDNAVTYVFGLSDGSIIDGAEGGNATRFINHSCAPNCAAYEVEGDDGTLRIEIEALQRIRPGGELFIDYSLDVDAAAAEDYACGCGAATCRGTLTAQALD